MAEPSIFLYQDKFGKSQPRVLYFNWKITGAKTVVALPVSAPVLTAYDAIAAQSTIDNFLGTTSEFNVLAFDATSMGTDAFAFLVPMAGQGARLDGFSVRVFSGTGSATVYSVGTWNNGLTNTTLETACALGTGGNLAVKCSFAQAGAFDSLTSGFIEAHVYWSAIK